MSVSEQVQPSVQGMRDVQKHLCEQVESGGYFEFLNESEIFGSHLRGNVTHNCRATPIC